MLTKLALLLLAAALAWRLLTVRKPRRPDRHIPSIDAERCPKCGVHRVPGRPCGCAGMDRR